MLHEDDEIIPHEVADVILDVVEEGAAQCSDFDFPQRDELSGQRFVEMLDALFVVENSRRPSPAELSSGLFNETSSKVGSFFYPMQEEFVINFICG